MPIPRCWLMEGDCLELMPDIPAGIVDMVMVDPPYGTTVCKWDSIIPLEPMWEELKRVTKERAAIVICTSQPFTSVLICSNLKVFKYCWVWDKTTRPTGFLNAKKQPLRRTEDVCVFYRQQTYYSPIMIAGDSHSWTGCMPDKSSKNYGAYQRTKGTRSLRYPINLLVVNRDTLKRDGTNHSTRKPVALMEYLIRTYTNEGETVLDFAMGSGTTGVACKNLKRKFIGIELDHEYFKIAKTRIS